MQRREKGTVQTGRIIETERRRESSLYKTRDKLGPSHPPEVAPESDKVLDEEGREPSQGKGSFVSRRLEPRGLSVESTHD